MKQPYAFFDFDGTLIPGDSIVSLVFYALRHGLCSPWHVLKSGAVSALYQVGLTSAVKAKQVVNGFLKGKTEAELAQIARDFAGECLLPRLYPQAFAEVQIHKAQGRQVWLVSASTDFYLRPVVEALGMDGVIGTRLHIQDGVCTGLIDGHNCRGVEKTLRIEEILSARGSMVDYDTSYAYGDSAGDVPMLLLCAHKRAVNPKKRLLAELKQTPELKILRWGKVDKP